MLVRKVPPVIQSSWVIYGIVNSVSTEIYYLCSLKHLSNSSCQRNAISSQNKSWNCIHENFRFSIKLEQITQILRISYDNKIIKKNRNNGSKTKSMEQFQRFVLESFVAFQNKGEHAVSLWPFHTTKSFYTIYTKLALSEKVNNFSVKQLGSALTPLTLWRLMNFITGWKCYWSNCSFKWEDTFICIHQIKSRFLFCLAHGVWETKSSMGRYSGSSWLLTGESKTSP